MYPYGNGEARPAGVEYVEWTWVYGFERKRDCAWRIRNLVDEMIPHANFVPKPAGLHP